MELLRFTIPLIRSFATKETSKVTFYYWDFLKQKFKGRKQFKNKVILDKDNNIILSNVAHNFNSKEAFINYCVEKYLATTVAKIKAFKLVAADEFGKPISASNEEIKIPTQDDLEQAIASAVKGKTLNLRGLYWIHRKAKDAIANLVKDALFNTPTTLIETYPIKINFIVNTSNTNRYDMLGILNMYMKVIPDVLTGQYDKILEGLEENAIVRVDTKGILIAKKKPILIDDSWRHINESWIKLNFEYGIKETLTVILEPSTNSFITQSIPHLNL